MYLMYYECVLFMVSRHVSKLFQKSNKRRELNEKVNECATGSNVGSWGYKSDNKCRQIVDSVRIACSNLLVFVVYFLCKGSSPVSRFHIKKSDSKKEPLFFLSPAVDSKFEVSANYISKKGSSIRERL